MRHEMRHEVRHERRVDRVYYSLGQVDALQINQAVSGEGAGRQRLQRVAGKVEHLRARVETRRNRRESGGHALDGLLVVLPFAYAPIGTLAGQRVNVFQDAKECEKGDHHRRTERAARLHWTGSEQ